MGWMTVEWLASVNIELIEKARLSVRGCMSLQSNMGSVIMWRQSCQVFIRTWRSRSAVKLMECWQTSSNDLSQAGWSNVYRPFSQVIRLWQSLIQCSNHSNHQCQYCISMSTTSSWVNSLFNAFTQQRRCVCGSTFKQLHRMGMKIYVVWKWEKSFKFSKQHQTCA